jgi:DNA-directed RNA polymerase subunit H (RpoH/RPB5)
MYANNQLDMLVSKERGGNLDGDGEKIYVKYYLGKPIRKEILTNIVEDLFEIPQADTNRPVLEPSDALVFIIDEEPNDTNIKQLQILFDRDGIFVMMYNIRRLQFNVRKHALNPEVGVVKDEKEVQEIREKFNIREWTQLPEISRFDPLAMSIFLRPGQIMRIRRDSPTSIENLYYRYCN